MDKKQQVNNMNSYIDANPFVLDDEREFFRKLDELAPDLYKKVMYMSTVDRDNYLVNNGILLVTYNDYTYREWLKELRKIEKLNDSYKENNFINDYPEYYHRHLIMCEINDGFDPVED